MQNKANFPAGPVEVGFCEAERWKKSGGDAQPTRKRLTASLRTQRIARSKRAKQSQFPVGSSDRNNLAKKQL